jgi:hypothetical protein
LKLARCPLTHCFPRNFTFYVSYPIRSIREQFFDQIGGLLERHVAIVVAMHQRHRGASIRDAISFEFIERKRLMMQRPRVRLGTALRKTQAGTNSILITACIRRMALRRKTLMKPMAGGALIGLLVALVVIYLLRPLNNGAIGLIIFICISIFASLGKLFSRRKK